LGALRIGSQIAAPPFTMGHLRVALVAWFGALFLDVVSAQPFTGNFAPNAAKMMEKIRQDVMERDGFSVKVPPSSDRQSTSGTVWGTCPRTLENGDTTDECPYYSDAGTDVKMQVRFFKVRSVLAADGMMSIKVWNRMTWKDTRLAWNASEYEGVTSTYYAGSNYVGDGDVAEIWTPDIKMYNSYEPMADTLEPTYATVSSDGTVFFSRPGTLEVMCKFSGLVAFPYDKLKCSIEFGGWALGGGQMGIQLQDGGYSFSNQEVTSGSSYTEYTINMVNVTYFNYAYACCPNDPWPVVLYTITLNRAGAFYLLIVIFPGIAITLCAFAVFWSDTSSADALGYGAAMIMANLLSQIALLDMLPICGEILWLDIFTLVNTLFCVLALVQSGVSIMLETFEDDHWFFTVIAVTYLKLKKLTIKQIEKSKPLGKIILGKKHLAEVAIAKEQESSPNMSASLKTLADSKYVVESVAGVLYRKQAGSTRTGQAPVKGSGQGTDDFRMRKLVFFESLFYKIDTDGSNEITIDEADKLLSFAALDLDPIDRESIFKAYDMSPGGKLNRLEFVMMCTDHLWNVPEDLLKQMSENLILAKTARTNSNSAYWMNLANNIEKQCRIWVPMAYVLSMIIVFSLDMSDKYESSSYPTESGMFEYVTEDTRLSTGGSTLLVIFIVLVILIGVSSTFIFHLLDKAGKEMIELQKQSARKLARDVATGSIGAAMGSMRVSTGDSEAHAEDTQEQMNKLNVSRVQALSPELGPGWAPTPGASPSGGRGRSFEM